MIQGNKLPPRMIQGNKLPPPMIQGNNVDVLTGVWTLGFAQVTDGIVKTLEKVKGLRSLRLGNTRVTDQGIRDLTKHLRELEEIRLDGEDGLSDVALEALGQVSTLTTVSLASCGDAVRPFCLSQRIVSPAVRPSFQFRGMWCFTQRLKLEL